VGADDRRPTDWADLQAGAVVRLYRADVHGWHQHTLGSGRTVTGIQAGPSMNGEIDALTMVTYDGAHYWLETLTDIFDEDSTPAEAWFVDAGSNPTSVVVGSESVSSMAMRTSRGRRSRCGAAGSIWATSRWPPTGRSLCPSAATAPMAAFSGVL